MLFPFISIQRKIAAIIENLFIASNIHNPFFFSLSSAFLFFLPCFSSLHDKSNFHPEFLFNEIMMYSSQHQQWGDGYSQLARITIRQYQQCVTFPHSSCSFWTDSGQSRTQTGWTLRSTVNGLNYLGLWVKPRNKKLLKYIPRHYYPKNPQKLLLFPMTPLKHQTSIMDW